MKQLVLICVMFAIATSAQAEDDRNSLFACGVNFGARQLTYAPTSDTGSTLGYRSEHHRLRHVMGASSYEPARFSMRSPAQPEKREQRLPRKFTFATLGCSWR